MGGHGECERTFEVFVKMQKNGGSLSGARLGGGGGVQVDK